MKPFYLILSATIATVCACQKTSKEPPLKPSQDYKKGQELLSQQNDSAFYYFNKVVLTSKDSLQVANAYNRMALIQSDAGDYYGCQESLLSSLRYLHDGNQRDFDCLSSDYNELGTASLNLKNYEVAIDYYQRAIKYSDNKAFNVIALNNMAVTYRKMGKYQDAISIYQSIITLSKKVPAEYARILSNLARTRWLNDRTYQATPDLWTALEIRKREKDDWGLNASYSHLSDYYTRSRPDSALFYARQMYAVAEKLESPDDEIEALQKLIPLSPPTEAKNYFLRYQFLTDSIQTRRNSAKNQFALIRYEAEKNKSDNLRLQNENAQKRVQIIQQRTIIYGTVVSLSLIIFLVARWYNKRQQKIRWDAENEIRENRLKTSQKVHDVVANGLYRIMSELEYSGKIEKEPLLDKIEHLYEKSRDISYELPKVMNPDFQQAIMELLNSFKAQDIQVVVVGNDNAIWRQAKDNIKLELHEVLQELMINMRKHSQAKNVLVKFEEHQDAIKIHYKDDGVGLPNKVRYGNGLTSTENRILGIGGRIIFENATKGLKIDIHLPIG